MFDEKTVNAFLNSQLKLYPETVAENEEEALEFLEDTCAVVAGSAEEVIDYLEETGVDTEGITIDTISDMPEIMPIGDGRYLILEI